MTNEHTPGPWTASIPADGNDEANIWGIFPRYTALGEASQ